jgi:uncharacterized protein YeaC (DUF1315 family)
LFSKKLFFTFANSNQQPNKPLPMPKLINHLLVYFVLLTSISAMPSMWPSSITLTNEDKNICTQFKILQGSNRIAEFEKIAQTIFNEQQETSNGEANKKQKTSNENDIQKLLGKADEVNQNGDWVYNLNPSQPNSKAIFRYNKLTHTINNQ